MATRSEPARRARLACGALALLLAACSDRVAAPDVPAEAPARQAAAGGQAAPAPEPAEFRGRLRRLPPWGDDLRRRIDPGADGWPTEVFAVDAERRLRVALAAALGGRAPFGAAFAELLDARATVTELYPSALRAVFDDGELRVLRAAELDATPHPAQRLDAFGAAWRAALAGHGEPRIELRMVGLQKLDGGELATELALRVSAGEEERVQHNLRLAAEWTRNGARIGALRLTAFEEVRAGQVLFRELTRAVLGADACFAEQVLAGNDDYHMRQDRFARQPFMGMHGIAVADIDQDGLEDVYLAQPGGQPNRLFLHQPDGTAHDGAAEAGVDFLETCGPVLAVDLDGDAAADLVTGVGANLVIAWNDGTGRFPMKTLLAGEGAPEVTVLSAADPDGDGDLDLFAGRYVAGGMNGGVPLPYYEAENGASDFYWRNAGRRTFHEVSAEVGLDVHTTRFALASIWEDFDEDGDPDLYVVNDFGSNCLYRNDGGRFTDVAREAGVQDTAAGMGAACADADLDGDIDLYVTNMQSPLGSRVAAQPRFQAEHPELRAAYVHHARGNTLLVNRGDGTFEDATLKAGVAPGGWAWGGNFIDWNNDGLEDIVVPNGFITNRRETDLEGFLWRCVIGASPLGPPAADYANAWDAVRHFSMFEGYSFNGHERDYAYLNLGGLAFADASSAAGLDFLDDGRAAASVDWDDDGRLDLLLRNRTGPRLRVLRNAHPAAGAFAVVELRGSASNRDAIGARVAIEAGGRRLRQTVYSAEGHLCASSRRLHFGLGAAERIDRLEVRWPSGRRESFADLAANERYRVVEGSGTIERVAPRPQPALAELPGEPLAVAPREVRRIPLFERLPLAPIELPRFAGEPLAIAAYRGRPLLVAVGPFHDQPARALLAGLARRNAELQASEAEVLALSTAAAARLDAARAGLSRLGLGERCGPADERFRLALEVVLVEVLGPYESLPLPIVLLIDRAGQLVVVHCGTPDVARVLADLALVARDDGAGRGTEAWTGGRWITRPARDFASMAEVFALLGRDDLARHYRAEAEARGAPADTLRDTPLDALRDARGDGAGETGDAAPPGAAR